MTPKDLQASVRGALVELVLAQETAKSLSYGESFEAFADLSSDAGHDLNAAVGEALASLDNAINVLGDVETTLDLMEIDEIETAKPTT